MEPTIQTYAGCVRAELATAYPEYRESTCVDFAANVEQCLREKRMGFIHDSPAMVKAWRTCGGKGRPTWKALFALRDEKAPSVVERVVREGLGEDIDFCPSDNA